MSDLSPSRAADETAPFQAGAEAYEAWYATPKGRRADRAEQALIAELLQACCPVGSILEIGSGTGHFTEWLHSLGRCVYGVDQSRAMLTEHRRRGRRAPVVLGDAHALPIRTNAVDVVLLVTTLEFLADPVVALRECVRVAKQGLVVVALNRHSLGALHRRWRGGAIVSRAHDVTRADICSMIESAAGNGLRELDVRSTLFPGLGARVCERFPFGDVLGAAATLDVLHQPNA